jgi:hypothetical protein
MKITRPVFFVWIVILLRVSQSAGQGNAVYYGAASNALGVAFADTNLSAAAKTAITADLQSCLSEWGKTSELDLGAYEPGLVGYLDNVATCPHYPEGLGFPKNIISTPSGLTLQVPKKLSDAYANAFAFAAANSNAVAAAYEFVAFVSSSNFVSTVTSNTIHNYILVKDTSSDDPKRNVSNEYYQVEFSGIIEGVFQYLKYYPPSVLGFYHTTNGPGTTNFCVKLPAKSNSVSAHDEWDGFPAVWYDNRWKICIGYEWVP